MKRLFRNPHAPEHLRDRGPGLGLLRRKRDLFLGEPALLHGSVPSPQGLTNRNSHSNRTRSEVRQALAPAGAWPAASARHKPLANITSFRELDGLLEPKLNRIAGKR